MSKTYPFSQITLYTPSLWFVASHKVCWKCIRNKQQWNNSASHGKGHFILLSLLEFHKVWNYNPTFQKKGSQKIYALSGLGIQCNAISFKAFDHVA